MSVTFLEEISLPFERFGRYGQALVTVYPGPGPFIAEAPPWLIGTDTVAVAVVVLPCESLTLNVIV